MVRGTRRWRWIRPVGTVACAVLGALYGFGLVHSVHASISRRISFWVVNGGLWIVWPSDTANLDWFGARGWPSTYSFDPPGSILYWFHHITTAVEQALFLPLWLPLLTAALPTAYAWRRCRHFPPGHCPNCNYNLTGNTTNICPECGNPADPTQITGRNQP